MTRHDRRAPAALAALLAALVAAGCATAPAGADRTAAPPAVPVAAAWQAPLPHAGQPADLARWWARFDDSALTTLIDRAQAASPTLASATARIAQARAARVSTGAALLPQVDAAAGVTRGRSDLSVGPATTANAGLQASWELDLFGANAAARDAAQARLEGAQSAWHAARVALAAETATSFTSLRACEAQFAQQQVDATSRGETARLTDLSERAGFQSPATAALARASAAQGRAAVTALRAQCDAQLKSLVALTALDEPALRALLAPGTAKLPSPAAIAPSALPASLLSQRPDLFEAERALAAAAADRDAAQAQRWPRVSLGGSFGALAVSTGGTRLDGTTWSIGPLQVSLPVFDGGRRSANVDAARATYDEAGALYLGRVRTAVREVEEALVQLDATARRRPDAQAAAEGFEQSLRAAEARFKGGLGSLFELEDARRSAIAARIALIDLERERATAWITLYRSLGGGWAPGAPVDAAAANTAARP